MKIPGLGMIGVDGWDIDGDSRFSVITEHIMEGIPEWHWEDIRDSEKLQPWKWYHGKYNHKIGGYPTALLDRHWDRLYAVVNQKFVPYYERGRKWQTLPNGQRDNVNRTAILDPCNAFGHDSVDDGPFVRLVGVSPETARRNKVYFEKDGSLNCVGAKNSWPSNPEPKINHVRGARAGVNHHAKSYDPTLAHSKFQRSERMNWEEAENDPENQWRYAESGSGSSGHR